MRAGALSKGRAYPVQTPALAPKAGSGVTTGSRVRLTPQAHTAPIGVVRIRELSCRHGDASRTFRRGVYAVIAFMVLQTLVGLAMYVMGFRPAEEVHLIYGLGALLSLPFFVYVETTARKRPAARSVSTGASLTAARVITARPFTTARPSLSK